MVSWWVSRSADAVMTKTSMVVLPHSSLRSASVKGRRTSLDGSTAGPGESRSNPAPRDPMVRPPRRGLKPLPAGHLRAESEAMTQNLLKTDYELKTAIVDELAWTPSVNADRIGVSLDAGAVTLSGQVETYPEKDMAVRAVTRVAGVTAVADEIVVKNDRAPRDDADIAREASEALNRMVHVPADAVRAIVHNQVVTLSGTVVWEYQREITQRAVAALPGVNGVINKMTLKPKVSITPDQAKAEITAAWCAEPASMPARSTSRSPAARSSWPGPSHLGRSSARPPTSPGPHRASLSSTTSSPSPPDRPMPEQSKQPQGSDDREVQRPHSGVEFDSVHRRRRCGAARVDRTRRPPTHRLLKDTS